MSSKAQNALLPPEWYWQPEHLEQERAALFHKNWIFAGFTDAVALPNDYLSFTVAGLPVVIRRMKDKLVAFRNICSHRHSIIHPEGCGNGMFKCPFHGWTYDADGVPIGIPDNKNSFGFDAEDKKKLALDPVEVDQCGRFLFVRVTPGGVSLRNWLDKLAPQLEHISTLFEKTYGAVKQEWACNWKLGLEITVEGYHLPTVHGASFEQHIGGSRPENESSEIVEGDGVTEYIGLHSMNTSSLSESSMTHLTTVADRLRLPRSEQMNGYHHILLFPNVMIGVNGGTNVCIERYEPLAADKTLVECWLMTGAPNDPKLYDGIIWRTMMKQWQDWTASVLMEDQIACEGAQRGLRFAHGNGLLGGAEERVRHYQAALRDDMQQKVKAV